MMANFDPWEIAMEFELSLTVCESSIELMPPAKWAGRTECNLSVQTPGLSLAQVKIGSRPN